MMLDSPVKSQTSYRAMRTTRSPLRYPGGKSRAVAALLRYIPQNLREICSPFLGGGNLELVLAANGVTIFGNDVFAPLINFWQKILEDAQAVARRARHYYPLARDEFYRLQREFHTLDSPLEQAAIFYVLNRASFSGTTLSGGMSPDHPRWTKSALDRLEDFNNPNLSASCGDYEPFLEKHRGVFLYLDPPYCLSESSNLYGYRGDTHRDFDHKRLARVLEKRKGWVLSYNDCEEIRSLYRKFSIESLHWSYGMNNYKQEECKPSNEIIILSS